MADLNRTIDRSIRISRTVSDLSQRRMRAAGERYTERLRSAYAQPSRARARRKRRSSSGGNGREYTIDATQRSVLYWDTLRRRGNQWLEHEAAGKPPVLNYKYEMIADARAYERPANYALVRIIPPKGIEVDDTKRPFVIVDPRAGHGPGHRRLQGGVRSRRRAVGRSRRVLRDLLPGPDAGTDARRRDRRRGRVHPHRRRTPSGQPEARDRRQLPGRLGRHDAGGGAPGHRGPARHQRRADVVLVGQRRRLADALRGRPAGRRVAVAVRVGPGRRQVRRRASRLQLREPESRQHAVGEVVPPVRRTSTPSPRASSSSNAGGAASTCSTRKRSAGSSTTCSSATSWRPARRGSARAATST